MPACQTGPDTSNADRLNRESARNACQENLPTTCLQTNIPEITESNGHMVNGDYCLGV